MKYFQPGSDSGCTAVVALLRKDELVVANAGDSRCVLCRDGKAIDLSIDHKPEDDEERRRIEGAGGKVTADGRVNGGLNLSRALGQYLSHRPYIFQVETPEGTLIFSYLLRLGPFFFGSKL